MKFPSKKREYGVKKQEAGEGHVGARWLSGLDLTRQ